VEVKPEISKVRLWAGGFVLVVGFLSPLAIPLVTSSGLSLGLKSTLAGLLAFGIPEVFTLIAVSIMGKAGFDFIKSKLARLLKPFAPPDRVSHNRYRFGLIFFILPLLFGFLQPYIGHYLTIFETPPVFYYIISDVVFLSSFFILGGEFWDKLRGLFSYNMVVVRKTDQDATGEKD
jgi:hypothetical protein